MGLFLSISEDEIYYLILNPLNVRHETSVQTGLLRLVFVSKN